MDNNNIDDIVTMLDNLMKADGGHVNIVVNNNADTDGQTVLDKSIETTNSLVCNGQMACSVPTLHQGLDADENE